MTRRLIAMLAILGGFATTACNTVEGLGQDVEQGGESLSNTANEVEQEISQ